jgi:hypothetical protein
MGTMAGDPAQNGEQPQDRPEPDAGPRRGRRANDRSGKMQHRRNEPRPVTARQGSSGPQKRTGVDPDSPFAALSALKLALEKRAQDPSSS